MMRRLSSLILLLPLLALCEAPPLDLDFGKEGFSHIKHFGHDILAPDGLQLTVSDYRQGEKFVGQPKVEKSYFDSRKGMRAQRYDAFDCTWQIWAADNTLYAKIGIENRSKEPITGITLILCQLQLPKTENNTNQQKTGTSGLSDGPDLVARLDGEYGRLGLGNWNLGQPVVVASRYQADQAIASIKVAGITSPPVEHPVYSPAYLPPKPSFKIAPGETQEFRLSITFGDNEATLAELGKGVLDRYVKQHPYQQNWPDRRPIGALFLAQAGRGWKTNPRGYITGTGAKEDVTTPAGVEAFGKSLIEYAHRCVDILQQANAQGVIVWDIEGQQAPHAISYVGDPRSLPLLAPEMDKYADAFMKVFTDAGLKVGVTVRPTEIVTWKDKAERDAYPYKTFGGQLFQQREVPDPGATVIDKVAYARKRWGCSIFYFDSNVHGKMWLRDKATGADPKFSGVDWQMPLSFYERVFKADPDVLFIPEWGMPSMYATASPYRSCNLNQIFGPPLARDLYPKSFSVIMPNTGTLNNRLDDYRKAVQQGNIMLFNAWYPCFEMYWAKAIYQEAQFLAQPAPDDPVYTRWAEARKLADSKDATAIAALAKLTRDPELVVANAAVESLAALPLSLHQQDEQGVEALKALLAAKGGQNECLHRPAADALGKLGTFGAAYIAGVLNDPQAKAPAMRLALAALARQDSLSPELAPILVRLLRRDGVDDGLRLQLAELAGQFKAREAVPALVSIVQTATDRRQEDLSLAAVEALGRIGDRGVVSVIIANWDRRYQGMAVYRRDRVMNTALAELTGEHDIFGAKGWKAWAQSQHH